MLSAQGEVGTDTRLTTHGTGGSTAFDAEKPNIAYNPTVNEYFVVYEGVIGGGEDEIFAQRYDAATGNTVGPEIRVSRLNSDGSTSLESVFPNVAYNATDDNYLVVWEGDETTNGEFEIFTEVVSALGVVQGGLGTHTKISAPLPATGRDCRKATIAYNSADNEFFVTYYADLLGTDNVYNVYGQRVDVNGNRIGTETQISTLTSSSSFDAEHPAVVYNPANNEYLVTFREKYSSFDFNIKARRVSHLGAMLGTAINVTNHSGTASAIYDEVIFNPLKNEYFVAWIDDRLGDSEIFGQALSVGGTLVGSAIQLSSTGATNTDGLEVYRISNSLGLGYSPNDGEIHIAYLAEEVSGGYEAHVAVLDAANYNPVSLNNQVSDMGNNPADGSFDASSGARLAFSTVSSRFLIVWEGDDDDDGASNDEEIYGQAWEGFATNGGLPVELLSFEAKRNNKVIVDLKWVTASEENTSHFEIERMIEGEGTFEKVGEVQAIGTTSATSYYNFEDENGSPNLSYYRLRIVDKDASFEYSAIKTVNGLQGSGTLVDIYPNPIIDKVFVRLQKSAEEATIQIVDAKGAVIQEQHQAVPANRILSMRSLDHLPKGTYWLKIHTDTDEPISQKFVKK